MVPQNTSAHMSVPSWRNMYVFRTNIMDFGDNSIFFKIFLSEKNPRNDIAKELLRVFVVTLFRVIS